MAGLQSQFDQRIQNLEGRWNETIKKKDAEVLHLNGEVTKLTAQISDISYKFDQVTQAGREAVNTELINAKAALDQTVESTNATFKLHQDELVALKNDAESKYQHNVKQDAAIRDSYTTAQKAFAELNQKATEGTQKAEAAYEAAKQSYEQLSEKSKVLWESSQELFKQIKDTHEISNVAFGNVDAKIEKLNTVTFEKFTEVEGKFEQRVRGVEEQAKGLGGRRSDNPKAKYIPLKNIIPKILSNKEEEWRQWKEDVMDYLDETTLGVKDFLENVSKLKGPIEIEDEHQMNRPDIASERVAIWRALKALTAGDARDVVAGVEDENGWRAWQKLHGYFEPSLNAKKGQVLAELAVMTTKPARGPIELRSLLLEMEKKIKTVKDIIQREVDDDHSKSILITIMDPITRQHTASSHGEKYKE